MLTTPSGTNFLTGYPAQLDVANTVKPLADLDRSSSNPVKTEDTVDISTRAKKLQQTYDQEKQSLDQHHDTKKQELEREYLQKKEQLDREFNQKKQTLDINVVA